MRCTRSITSVCRDTERENGLHLTQQTVRGHRCSELTRAALSRLVQQMVMSAMAML